MNRTYRILTLGCKVNQCESAALGHELDGTGAVQVSSDQHADMVVINTCTVTGRAAMQSRQAIRKAIRENPEADIIVTGCYAQTAPEEIAAIQGVSMILGHNHKLRLANHLMHMQPRENKNTPCSIIHDNIFTARQFAPLASAAPQGRTRAFLKIQDGCNTMCSYCIVPYARGRSRSMRVAEVMAHLRSLSEANIRETVLTGIHLGAYGTDLKPPTTLTQLLAQIIKNDAMDRIRLSSIEPTEIDDDLLEIMAATGTLVCPHLHIPLQSGDNGILKRMGRPYTREVFADIVQTVRRTLPHAAIGADVLVGFPGEDEAAFQQTFDLIETLPLTYLHVFPYSPRKGTPAATFDGKVPERITKKRCERLRALGRKKKTDFFNYMIGRTVEVLVQDVGNQQEGALTGISDNYLEIRLTGATQTVSTNSLLTARIEAVETNDMLRARIISD